LNIGVIGAGTIGKLQVGFNRRFDPNFARVIRAVAEGEIGERYPVHIISRD
jgi:myo-inositol 2-dehydrogenase/D-chiro-inositol 1-dehydrogenase